MKLLKLIALLVLAGCAAYDLGEVPIEEVPVDTSNPLWINNSLKGGIKFLLFKKCDDCHHPTLVRPGSPTIVVPYGFSDGDLTANQDTGETMASNLVAIYQRVFLYNKENKTTFFVGGNTNNNKIGEDHEVLDDPMPLQYGNPLSASEKKALCRYLDNFFQDQKKLDELETTEGAANNLFLKRVTYDAQGQASLVDGPGAVFASVADATAVDEATFNSTYKPLLQRHCGLCHGKGEFHRFQGFDFNNQDSFASALSSIKAGRMPPRVRVNGDQPANLPCLTE